MPVPAVQILFNDRLLDTVPLQKAKTSIGRMRENDIVIDNLGVSRFHANLIVSGDEVVLEDQNSENGCFVNGERISRCVITPQDEIIIGKHRLILTQVLDPSLLGNERREPSTAWDTSQEILQSIEIKHDKAPHGHLPDPLLDVYFQDGSHETKIWNKATLSIGRAMENDIVFMHPQVSRRHAMLVRVEDRFEVHDLDTGNGTLVNGKRQPKHLLKSGDVVTIGSEKIIFRIPGAMAERAAQPSYDLTAEAEKPTVEVPLDPSPLATPASATEIVPFYDDQAAQSEHMVAESASIAPPTVQQIALEVTLDLSYLPEDLQKALTEQLEAGVPLPAQVRLKIPR